MGDRAADEPHPRPPGARAPTGPDGGFEPALYRGGRVDVEVDGVARSGHLHLGFALVGDEDVFATAS